MTVGTRIAIRSRLQSRLGILTNQQTWKCFSFVPAPPRLERGNRVTPGNSNLCPLGTLRQMGDSALWETCEETFKGTYPLTPRGGFFDGRNQNRDPEPSAKPSRHSDKRKNLEIISLEVPEEHDLREKYLRGKEPLLRLANWDHGSPAQAKLQRNLFTDSPRWIL